MESLAYTFSGFSFALVLTFLIRPVVPYMFLLVPKVIAQNTSNYLMIMGITGAALGWIQHAFWPVALGLVGAMVFGIYAWRCTRGHQQFENVFGSNWMSNIKLEQKQLLSKKRWFWYRSDVLPMDAQWQRDVTYCTIPDREQALFCDLWLPVEKKRSGLAFVYLHGSAWALGSKDMATRPFFRHLVTQGHVVMDINYRLCPEVDIFGMVGDAQRAVAWIKNNAKQFGVDTNKIVLSGGSAGGHVALLAAYTASQPTFRPNDIGDADTSVCGAVSLYGTIDLVAGYRIYRVEKLSKKHPKVTIGTKVYPKDFATAGRYAGRPDIFLGGTPDEVPEVYALANPNTHVNANTPPTFIAQGSSDFLTPPAITLAFCEKLRAFGVPSISRIFPATEHAYDLFLPQLSPATHSTWYDLDRFLAILAAK